MEKSHAQRIVSQWRIFAFLERVSFSLSLVACSAPTYYLQCRHHLNLTLNIYPGRFLVWGKRKLTCFQITVIRNANDIYSIAVYNRNIFIHFSFIDALKLSNLNIIINVWYEQPIQWCCVQWKQNRLRIFWYFVRGTDALMSLQWQNQYIKCRFIHENSSLDKANQYTRCRMSI